MPMHEAQRPSIRLKLDLRLKASTFLTCSLPSCLELGVCVAWALLYLQIAPLVSGTCPPMHASSQKQQATRIRQPAGVCMCFIQ